MRNLPPLALALLCARLSACTGDLGDPSGPTSDGYPTNDSSGGAQGDGDGDADGNDDGEPPANVGTGIFELCEEGATEEPGPRLLRMLTRREYRNTVRDLLFVSAPDVSTLPIEARVRGFDNNAYAAAVTSRHIDELMKLGESLAAQAVREQKSKLVSCSPSDACARTFVETFGLRAFRRPLSDEEVTRYTALFDDGLTAGDFDEGLRLTIQAMLVSPAFMYRSEVGSPDGDGNLKLDQYEIASALSYLYWASMPDATLFEAAGAGRLDSAAALEAEAERLLDDPRAREQLGEFSLQWLRSDNVISASKDAAVYPNFTDSLREAMVEEQRRFFTKVVLDDLGSYEDLLVSNLVIANSELAGFYGLSGAGGDYTELDVDAASGRGGLLGMGAVLAAHAHSNESSPIKRGLFVRDRLLCQNLPAPPEEVDTTPPGLDPTLTTRERFKKHTEAAECAGCHSYIDGIGFGFEGFDGIGARREQENGLAVDESGSLVGLESLTDNTTDAFEGARELAALIVDSPNAQACLSLQYFRFARGYEERKSDACSLAVLQDRFEKQDLTVKELLLALPTLKSFVMRKE